MGHPFARTYVDARTRFLAAAGEAGAAVTSLRAPRAGPSGEALYLDRAVVGDPAAPVRIVISSGLHGVEGYCGSACQIAWLESGAPLTLPWRVCVILVHALSPYGFAWGRRFNEDNVDLNRNFLDEPWNPPQNPLYAALRAAVAANPLDRQAWDRAQADLAAYRESEGEGAYLEALAGGQYEDPPGIFYGGSGPSWTRRIYPDLLRELLAGCERAILYDIHTGIGDYGELVPFCMTGDDDPRIAVATEIFGQAPRTPARSKSGGRARRGLMLPYLDSLGLAPSFLPLGIEFGTVPLPVSIVAVRAENWIHHHGLRNTADGRRIVAQLREAFCPMQADWEHDVVVKSAAGFRRLIERAAAL